MTEKHLTLKARNLTGILLQADMEEIDRDADGGYHLQFGIRLSKNPNTLEALALSVIGGDNQLGALAIRDLVEEGGLEGDRARYEFQMIALCKEVIENYKELPRSTLFKLRAVLNEMYKSKIGKFQP